MTLLDSVQRDGHRPHIVMVLARGEAVRNFLYSDTLPTLSRHARVTLLSVMDDEEFVTRFSPPASCVVPLIQYPERRLVKSFRRLVHQGHFRWLWTEAVKTTWARHDAQAVTLQAKAKRMLWKAVAYALARRRVLEYLTEVERRLTWALRTNDDYLELWRMLKPDLVFNTSHVHAPAADLPVRIARMLGIRTAAFIFSWDNPTSRSRIFPRYDYFLTWNNRMRGQLRELYPTTPEERILVTGTPQFDFHFRPQSALTREQLAQRIGIDPGRPFVLYTTGIARHLPNEHVLVETTARMLRETGVRPTPQLVVRTYIKGTSPETKALAAQRLPGVTFAPMLWEEKWHMPLPEDQVLYSALLRHAQVGINVGSTVSLELLMHNKPVINIAYAPAGVDRPEHSRYLRYPQYEHYRPVIESGAVMVARSEADLREMLGRALTAPGDGAEARHRFLDSMFGSTLDGRSGARVGQCLLEIAARVS